MQITKRPRAAVVPDQGMTRYRRLHFAAIADRKLHTKFHKFQRK
jgi:hypothetical protein